MRLLHQFNHWTLTLIISSIQHGRVVYAWQEWKYSSFTSNDWREIWGGIDDGPRSRRGHSMVLWDKTKVVMFGGRDNEVHTPDVPKTYDLVDDNGILKFDTYDEKPVRSNYDPTTCQPKMECRNFESSSSSKNIETCSYSWDHVLNDDMTASQIEAKEEQCGFTTSGIYYNDIWMYDVSCTRLGDDACKNDGWRVLHPGARFGGCRNEFGNDLCDVPFARWGHGAAMMGDNTMFVYGGYSQECEDYCDDVWKFDLKSFVWERVEFDPVPTPGRRWKFSMDGFKGDGDKSKDNIITFGGHRLWHGVSMDNSEENLWQNTDMYEFGGYLNDLWILSEINVVDEEDNQGEVKSNWAWVKKEGKETCRLSPGLKWKERNNIICDKYWPKERSGHASVFDEVRNGLWIHGGFTSHYPYPSSSSPGSANGVKASREKGFIPFASHSYYLNDLWFYNITSGYWKQMKQRLPRAPTKRRDHVMVLSGNILIIHGGDSENMYYNDTWYYYIDENRWYQKKSHVHMFFPDDCSDDTEFIKEEENCIELQYPPPLQRSNESTYNLEYGDISPFHQQPGYTPDTSNTLYFGIVYNASAFVSVLQQRFLVNHLYDKSGNRIWIKSEIPDGTPIAPYAATGPRQFAQLKKLRYNETTEVSIWEWCTSVEGEPTRGMLVDGLYGRLNNTLHVPQLRRQSPGWDGCREVRWKYPPSRTDHKGIYIERYSMLFIYGGISYEQVDISTGEHPDLSLFNETDRTLVKNDLWIFGMKNCPKDCSSHGECTDGFCKCFPGYYGVDCGNITCPGSVCHYDNENTQHCAHCCYDGYIHSENDQQYEAGVRKIPCSQTGDLNDGLFTGNSNGICDGFGSCQCAPPFLGEDCSIRDCKNDCSFNGYCSLEFPNSRCICNEGYFGDVCQFRKCPNNCSFPNGFCNHDLGICKCEAIFSPYNESHVWSYWQGEDCSYLTPWCGCDWIRFSPSLFVGLIVLLLMSLML